MPDIKPVIPTVVEPEGVVCSVEPRPMTKGSEEEREKAVAETGGAPTVDFEGRSKSAQRWLWRDVFLHHGANQGVTVSRVAHGVGECPRADYSGQPAKCA